MPLKAFQNRSPENVPGKFYVSDQCLDCDLCREVAPENFARNDARGYSYVKKQPETPDELARCREALAGCCTETIYEDGDSFDLKSNSTIFSNHPQPTNNKQEKRRENPFILFPEIIGTAVATLFNLGILAQMLVSGHAIMGLIGFAWWFIALFLTIHLIRRRQYGFALLPMSAMLGLFFLISRIVHPS